MVNREDWGRAPQPERMVYVERPSTSVDRLTVPALLVVSVVGFAAWATWWGTNAVNDIQSSVKDIGQALTNYIVRADQRVLKIEEALKTRTDERLTKMDHEMWCLRTERINPNWRCGSVAEPPAGQPPIWEGAESWRTTEKPK